jgi:hypothetical protein
MSNTSATAADAKKRKSSSSVCASEPQYPSDVERARTARVGATLSSILSRVPGISIIDAWKQSLLKTMRECDPVTGYPCPKLTVKDAIATRAALEAAKLPFKRRGDPWTPPSTPRGGDNDDWKFQYPAKVENRPPSPTF